MNKGQKEIEDQTKDLLQKSLLKPISEDFDDLLMQKILQSPAHIGLSVKNNYYKKSWIFLTIALICFISSSLLIAIFSDGYFKDLDNSLSLILNYVLYGGLLLFIPLILYHFDKLIQVSISKSNRNLGFIS